jgi:very-short-patch-repair endonuclease
VIHETGLTLYYFCIMGIVHRRDSRLLGFAQENRKRPTISEAQMWHELRNYKLGGLKFRRQHLIDPFIVDFYCSEKKLAVEVDGDAHAIDAARIHDAQREAWLRDHGIRVLRFSHDRVIHDMDAVLAEILSAVT